jgi:glycosyltransferase involved in cell wall biosynthesis
LVQCSVSVALATCNGGRFLAQQLTDLADQSMLPSELVVCDDESSDETRSILEEFASRAPFPVHVHCNGRRLGYRENFIKCAGLCTSDLIAFCDQDDRWHPDKLQSLRGYFVDSEVLLVYHNARVVTEDGRSVAALFPSHQEIRRVPLSGAPWAFSPGFTQMFRRSLLEFDELWKSSKDENADGERIAHDRWYFFLASILGSIVYSPLSLVDYRQHGRNAHGWTEFAPRLPERILKRVDGAAISAERFRVAAESRAAILEKIARKLSGAGKTRALDGARMYAALAERWLLRSALYEANTAAERMRAFRSLMRSGAYGAGQWQTGAMGFAMDCLIGLTRLHSIFQQGSARHQAPHGEG